MKNIDISIIKEYNKNGTGSTEIYKFLQGNIIHLEEDITRFAKQNKKLETNRFADLKEKCFLLQENITKKKQFEDSDLDMFDAINKYNTLKNIEMKRLAIFTGIVAIAGAILNFLFK